MKVVYVGRQPKRTRWPESETIIELSYDSWDDAENFRTTFEVRAYVGKEVFELGSIGLLIESEPRTATVLDRRLLAGWSGEFPLPNSNYLSVPGDITFYEQLEGILATDELIEVARVLRDASYLNYTLDDNAAHHLVASSTFSTVLLRERGSAKAFQDGWRILEKQTVTIRNLDFIFKDVMGAYRPLSLRFESESELPHDINVLIGPNGSGKSQLMLQIVRDWIDAPNDRGIGFSDSPNFSQLIVVSYSPFEQFPVDLLSEAFRDQGIYRYFGFRGRASPYEKDGYVVSPDIPKRRAAYALIACAKDDRRYRAIRNWPGKIGAMEGVLRTAFDFDFAAVEIPPEEKIGRFFRSPSDFHSPMIDLRDGRELRRFIPMTTSSTAAINLDALTERLSAASGVTFFSNGQPVELSSGQRLFAYLVLNILGAIRRNSLILIDEPEVFLHPTLEIQFIDMLKTILARFRSKALLATHSVVTVREVPSDCVHVMERTRDGLVLKRPPFQTFGGDVQRISSYVFGDRAASKPFETWIREQLQEKGSAEALLKSLSDEISEELTIQIRAMDRR